MSTRPYRPKSWTIRPTGIPPEAPAPPSGAGHVLGDAAHARWLRLSGYGRFDLLAADGKAWQVDVFAKRCAGCHTTAVDPAIRAFFAFAVDCFSCHGVVASGHTGDTALVWLSRKHDRKSRLIVSICGQCHLRGGRSLSSGLPYPNNFVAGDDLFADFRVDLKRAGDASLNSGDRHVYRNVGDVLERGSDVACLSCHPVHGDSAQKHHLVMQGEICLDCHDATGPKKNVKRYQVHSPVCEY